MTDSEINEAVARKLNIPKHDYHGIGGLPMMACGDPNCKFFPDYCHSIEAAWEIVERPDFSWQIYRYANGSFTASLFTGEPPNARFYEGEADTAPMAICLAFLSLP